MPQTGNKRAEPPTEEEKERIVSGPDPDRFYCPHPGCNRSFAELWRLKVHFRAPPDVRGSGKERGHGTELKFCPKCGKDLRPGKHHVGCSAGKSAPRQAAKRQRQQMSTTTESQGQAVTAATTAGTTEQTSGSWELAVRRQAAKQRQASEAESVQRTKRAEACRLETLAEGLVGGADLLFHAPSFGAAAGGGEHGVLRPSSAGAAGPSGRPHPAPAAGGGHFQQQKQQHHQLQQQQQQPPAQLPQFELPRHGSQPDLHRGVSPSPLDLFGDPFGASNAHLGGGVSGAPGGAGGHGLPASGSLHNLQQQQQQQQDEGMLRIPSPPPFPSEWETGARPGLLFDFDQFDINKRNQAGSSAPVVTVTTAMNPADMLNPSDDYIWQILFAGENDAVPKRVTAHLHHPPAAGLSYFDEADPLLDAMLSDDTHHPQQQLHQQQPQHVQQYQQYQPPPPQRQQAQQQQQQQQQQYQPPPQQYQPPPPQQQHQNGMLAGMVPTQYGSGGGGVVAFHHHHQSMLPSLDSVFSQQHHHHQQQQQAAREVPQHQFLGQSPQQPAYRNGFGVHDAAELVPAGKLEGTGFL